MTIALTTKQQTAVKEFATAISSLQQQQQMYLKAILDSADDVAADSKWSVNAAGTELVSA